MKKYFAIFSILMAVLLSTAVTYAGEGIPFDNFAGAETLVIQNGGADVTVSNTIATKEAGEPNHARNAGGKSIWFKITPTSTTVLRINIMDATFDTLLAVYTGTGVHELTPVGYNDDCSDACGNGSTVDVKVTAGVTYYIAVDGFNDNGTVGSGLVRLVILDNGVPFQDDLASSYNLGGQHSNSIGGTNYNATRQAGEPEHVNPVYPGAKSVWYRWKPTASFSVEFELEENFDSQISVYRSPTSAPTFADLTRVVWNFDAVGDSYSRYRAKFFAEQGFSYFIAISGHSQNPQATDSGNFQLTYRPSPMGYSMNTDPRRSRTAISVFRPSEGTWYTHGPIGSPGFSVLKWGLPGDVPLAADFNGDGMTEPTVARNENGLKIWYIRSTPAPTVIQWGLASDKPVIGDFDFDSRADLTVIRNTAQGYVWYIRKSSNGALRTFVLGTTGDRPILGDFDGDGATEVAVVRNTASGLVWHFLRSGSGPAYSQWSAVQFGQAPDVPAVEDFDGDGKTDIAVFRPSNGNWYIYQSSDGQVRIDNFGLNGDKPQPADYNGDGKADLCVFRPSDGTWYIAKPTGIPGQNYFVIPWGLATDLPVSSLAALSQ